MVRKHLLEIPIDCLTMQEAVGRLHEMVLLSDKQYIVTTVNPEFVVDAQHDPEFKAVLKKADLSLPDGFGVQLAVGAPERLSGVDVIQKMFEHSSLQGPTLRVFLLGARHEVAEKAGRVLEKRYSNVRVVGVYEGPHFVRGKDGDLVIRAEIIRRVSDEPVDLLLVAFGHGKQEKWIARNLPYLPVKVAMGVGGAFDYLAGAVPRAPGWARNLGCEWLFRLVVQPWRVKRQWKLLYFLWLVLFSQFSSQMPVADVEGKRDGDEESYKTNTIREQ